MAAFDVLPLESLPLGFRFCPTDEELLNHYLRRKIEGRIKADSDFIPVVDVCKCEPWDLPEKSRIKSDDPEWFFFAPKYRKYPNGQRLKRATDAGYWKATGKDRTIKTRAPSPVTIGMKKTLVFYRGRAPKGLRTGWIMHEYRIGESGFEGGFVLCRLFNKPVEAALTSIDDVDSSGFSPAPSRSSPDATAPGDDSLDEFTKPLHLEISSSNLNEIADKSMEKAEETHSNSDITADIALSDLDIDIMKDDPALSELFDIDPGSEQHGSDAFHYGPPSDYHLSHPSFVDTGAGVPSKDEDDDSEFVTEFLNAILVNNEEESSPESNKFLESAAKVVPASQVYPIEHESLLDGISLSDNLIGNNSDIETLLSQENTAVIASCQLLGPMSPSSYFMPPLPNSYNEFGAQFNLSMETADFHYAENLGAQSMNSFNGDGMFESIDHSHDLFINGFDPPVADSSVGTGIKIRSRGSRGSNINPNQQRHQAFSRIRLQTSLHRGSSVIAVGRSSSANGGQDEKAEMSESGKNAEVEAPTSNRATEKAYFGSSDNEDAPIDPIRRLGTNELCVEPEGPLLKETLRTAAVYFGRVTVVIPVILCVLCIGIGWFFGSR